MAEMYSFPEDQIQAALDAARQHHEGENLTEMSLRGHGNHLAMRAACIAVTVSNGKVCLNLPLKFGSVCLPIPPFVPNGTAAQACIDICTKLGIPTGVRVTVTVAGQTVVNQSFGIC